MKDKILTVSIKDCRVDTFRSGGKGGQHQNKTESGVRLTHEPSGAVAESREERSQLQNKRRALERLSRDPKFLYWVSAVTRGLKTEREIEAEVQADLDDPEVTITEVKVGKDRWQKVRLSELEG